MSSLNEIKLNMNHVEDSVAFLGNKYNDLSVQMKEIKSKIKPCNRRINLYDLKFNDSQMIAINHMKVELNRQEQYSRCECLETSEILFQESKNAIDIVIADV